MQVRERALDRPTAARVMADDRVKEITAVTLSRRAVPNNLFDFVDVVAAAVAVEADRRSSCRRCRLVLLPEKHAPVHQAIDIAKAAALAQIQTGNRQRLVGARNSSTAALSPVSRSNFRFSELPVAVPQIRKPLPLGVISA